jgi:type I restriction enzyme, S subunit
MNNSIDNHELKEGYKQTDVGTIPEDWEVVSIKEIGNIRTGPFGTLLKANEYSDDSEGTPLISVGEIGEGVFRINKHTPLIPKSVVRRLPEYVLKYGDIVFGRKGAVERSAMIDKHQAGWFLGSDGIRIRFSKSINPLFVSYQFQRNQIQSWLIQNATGTTMASMNQEILGRVIFPLSPLPEQQAIAEVLSDVDALITSLDQLVTKKRNIKQGTMQLLLTGEKRLITERKAGYQETEIGILPNDWEIVMMKKFTNSSAFGPRFSGDLYSKDGNVATLRTTDLDDDGNINYSKMPMANLNVKNFKEHLLRKNDFLITRSGTCGIAAVFEGFDKPVLPGAFLIRFRLTEEADSIFLKYYINSEAGKKRMDLLAFGAVQKNISGTSLLNTLFPLPPIEEQKAIAQILSEMDEEIEALEIQRDKYKAVKQGMMQELLTGKTRLI